ncbi:hypothetical protein FRC02_010066 [Tulasnella sp. 418]|nr:hypothetical protein FRC02_010066 [Tulasnella sp. 418]
MQAPKASGSQVVLFEPVVVVRSGRSSAVLSPDAKKWIDEQLKHNWYPPPDQRRQWAAKCGVELEKINNRVKSTRQKNHNPQSSEIPQRTGPSQTSSSKKASRPYPSMEDRIITKSKILFGFPDGTVKKLLQLYDLEPDASEAEIEAYALALSVESAKVVSWYSFRRKMVESNKSPTPAPTTTPTIPQFPASLSPRSPTIAVKLEETNEGKKHKDDSHPEEDKDELSEEDMDIDDDTEPFVSKHYYSPPQTTRDLPPPSPTASPELNMPVKPEIGQESDSAFQPQNPHVSTEARLGVRAISKTPFYASPTPTRELSVASSEDIPLADMQNLQRKALRKARTYQNTSPSVPLAEIHPLSRPSDTRTGMGVSGDPHDIASPPKQHEDSPAVPNEGSESETRTATEAISDILTHSASSTPGPSNRPAPVIGLFSTLRTIASGLPNTEELPSLDDSLPVEERFKIHNRKVERMRSILAQYRKSSNAQ